MTVHSQFSLINTCCILGAGKGHYQAENKVGEPLQKYFCWDWDATALIIMNMEKKEIEKEGAIMKERMV